MSLEDLYGANTKRGVLEGIFVVPCPILDLPEDQVYLACHGGSRYLLSRYYYYYY